MTDAPVRHSRSSSCRELLLDGPIHRLRGPLELRQLCHFWRDHLLSVRETSSHVSEIQRPKSSRQKKKRGPRRNPACSRLPRRRLRVHRSAGPLPVHDRVVRPLPSPRRGPVRRGAVVLPERSNLVAQALFNVAEQLLLIVPVLSGGKAENEWWEVKRRVSARSSNIQTRLLMRAQERG